MNKYYSPIVNALEPYIPGEQPKDLNLIKLNTNENPYVPSPNVIETLKKEAADTLRLYPDPESAALKSAIARYYEIEPDQVFVGNGSDEVLAHTFLSFFCKEHPLLFPDISYSFYPVYAKLYNIEYVQVPLTGSFEVDIKEYQRPNGGIIIPNPNAPTGIILGLEKVKALVEQNRDSVVVMDEAYIDFGGETSVSMIKEYPNLLVIQTLSKSRSLAGLRVGLAIGDVQLIDALTRVKNSFNSYPLDSLAITGAIAAFEDRSYFQKACQKIIESREYLSVALAQLGFEVLPSGANFVFARYPEIPGEKIFRQLREQGILVRRWNNDRIKDFLRITIGQQDECEQLIQVLKAILRSK